MSETGPDGGLRNTVYRQVTRSGRRMTAGRRLFYRMIVPLGLAIVRFWWLTCRVVRVEGLQHLEAALADKRSCIPVYWHQHTLFCGRFLLDQRSRGLKPGWLVSPSVDGEIGAMMVARLGGHVIRGSSTNTGARALRDYYESLVRQQVSPAITPDGPRGPRFQFKPGAVLLAQMSGRPIVPIAYAAKRAWLIKWDKFVIPWPFSRIVIAVGEPCRVPRVLDAAGMERTQRALEAQLHALFRQARDSLDVVRPMRTGT